MLNFFKRDKIELTNSEKVAKNKSRIESSLSMFRVIATDLEEVLITILMKLFKKNNKRSLKLKSISTMQVPS